MAQQPLHHCIITQFDLQRILEHIEVNDSVPLLIEEHI